MIEIENKTADDEFSESAVAPPAGSGAGTRFAHTGLQYLAFLRQLAERSGPRSYLEIGTRDGSSLAAFGCDAVCVDPTMRPKPAALNRERTFCFQMTSDRFFRDTDLFEIFPAGVDIAFLDGMHRFEYVLRDFINSERYCRPDSIVLIHDCFPARTEITGRAFPGGGAWAGDVWKIVPILKELRAGLSLKMLDCRPTGLLLVQGLDPSSDALKASYRSLVDRFGEMTLEEYGMERLWSDVEPVESKALVEDEAQWSLTLATY